MKNITLRILILALIIICIFIVVYFLVSLYNHGYDIICLCKSSEVVNEGFTGQVGDFIGGVVGTFVSFVSVLLLILTLREQQNENRKASFEQTLTQMINRYNNILSEIQIHHNDGSVIKGRVAITEIVNRFMYMLGIVIDCVFKNIHNNDNLKKSYDDEKANRIAIKLAYGYFMYGYRDYHITKNRNKPIYLLNVDVTSAISNFSEDQLKFWEYAFSNQLGHYFRCIFSIVKYVAHQKWLCEDDKYQYVKQLRSVLSDKEQILLYYNALSDLGEQWVTPIGKTKISEMCYMARFRMIKNIPYYFEYIGINPKYFFRTEIAAYEKLNKKFFEIDLKYKPSISIGPLISKPVAKV